MARKIGLHEVIDHGYCLPDYFQGCGVAFTEFDDVATGCGQTRHDAYEGALEMLAQGDWDVEEMPKPGEVGPNASVPEDCEESCWYVSVRVRN